MDWNFGSALTAVLFVFFVGARFQTRRDPLSYFTSLLHHMLQLSIEDRLRRLLVLKRSACQLDGFTPDVFSECASFQTVIP